MATRISGPRGPIKAPPGGGEEGKPAAPTKGGQGDVDRVDGAGPTAAPDEGGEAKGRTDLLDVLAPAAAPRDRRGAPATPVGKMDPEVKDLVRLVSGEPRLEGVSKMSDAALMEEILGWMDDINLEDV